MFYNKPTLRCVDMCMYIDENVYKEDCDQALIYEYLYHIIKMIAIKRDYFDRAFLYDEFSLFAASTYFMRLTDKRQFKNDSNIEPIRSILNYVKKTLYSIRWEYVKKYVDNTPVVSELEFADINIDNFYNSVNEVIDPLKKYEFGSCLGSVPNIIKNTLKGIPYKQGSTMWKNIYISCLLSFLNSITLKNKDVKRLRNFKRPTTLTDKMLNELYYKERYDSTILFHLDDTMYNYITVLTNKVRRELSQELSQALNTYTTPMISMKNLLMSNINDEEQD